MEMMTESLGYRVLTAGGAAEALQIIGETAIDMLLSDIVMAGGMSGLELGAASSGASAEFADFDDVRLR